MRKATQQIALVATLRLRGLAVIREVKNDYVVFAAKAATVREALRVAEDVTNAYGIEIAIRLE